MVRGGSRWFAVVRGGSRRFAAVRGGSRRFAVVRGGSRWFATVRKLDKMYFFILDKYFQYIPKRNFIKNMIVSKF